jgi:hypothetical protein
MSLSDAYKKILNESTNPSIARGTEFKEIAEYLKTIAFMLENRQSTIESLGVDKVGDKIIEIGNKIKSL